MTQDEILKEKYLVRFTKILSAILITFFCYESIGCHRSNVIGNPLPNFSLPPFLGFPPVTSQTIKGKKTLIVVWTTWCGACRSLHPQLMEIAKKGEWRVIGINADSNPKNVANFLRENGNPFSALGQRRRIEGLPLSGGIPLIYAISAKGIILAMQRGSPLYDNILSMN